MKKSLSPLWVALTVWLLLPGRVGAQMDFSLEETQTEGTEASGEQATPPAEGEGSGGMADVIGALASESQQQATETEDLGPRRDEQIEEIYAVQQVYALRRRRAELMPNVAFNVNDPYQSHIGVGLSANYWWTNVLAIGANFLWYDFGSLTDESDLSFYVRRSTRLAIPINQWQTGAWLNFTYVPLYGKFAMFNKFIFQWDAYLVGGVGLMRTAPLPVIDPAVRSFDWENRLSFNVGLGIRIFLSRWLAFVFEFRDYMWIDKYENVNVEPLIADRVNPNTWYESGSSFVNNVSMGLGLTFFIPPRFEYRLPK